MPKRKTKLTLLEAIEIAEGNKEVSEDQYIGAWQYLIDNGHAWQLQGWYGRVASSLIQQGLCYYPTVKPKKKPVNTGGQTKQTPEEK